MAIDVNPAPTQEEIDEILDGLGAFVDRVVVPIEQEHQALFHDHHRAWDEKGAYVPEIQALMRRIRMESAEAGYYGMMVPEELGGGGQGPVVNFLAWEHLNHRYGPARPLPQVVVSHWSQGPSGLWSSMSDALRADVWPLIASGEASMCFALSEPDAGSDALAITTTATRDGDEWVINGTKQWITNSPYADYVVVFAVTGEGANGRRAISAFVVPTTAPGYRLDSVIRLFGEPGGNEGIISFSDVRVPDEHRLGDEGRALQLALGSVTEGRMYNAGRCVGLARWALETATEYATERRTFGQPISEYQGVSFQLADSAIEIYAARAMSLDCAHRLQRGEPSVREVAMVKTYTTEMCCRVYDRCMQVLGGMGITQEARLYEGWQQGRIVRIADGSAEIMRRNIARSLFRGEVGF